MECVPSLGWTLWNTRFPIRTPLLFLTRRTAPPPRGAPYPFCKLPPGGQYQIMIETQTSFVMPRSRWQYTSPIPCDTTRAIQTAGVQIRPCRGMYGTQWRRFCLHLSRTKFVLMNGNTGKHITHALGKEGGGGLLGVTIVTGDWFSRRMGRKTGDTLSTSWNGWFLSDRKVKIMCVLWLIRRKMWLSAD